MALVYDVVDFLCACNTLQRRRLSPFPILAPLFRFGVVWYLS